MPDAERTELTLPSWLTSIGRQPHGACKRALRDDFGEVTFAELTATMERVGAGLLRAGLRPGDRVVTAMEPSVSHAAVILGAMAGGMVAAPLNTRFTAIEATSYLATIDPAVIVTDSASADLARATGRRVIELPSATDAAPLSHRLAPLAVDGAALAPVSEAMSAIIFPTGGTTGTPKGAIHSHRSLWLWLNTCAQGNPRTPNDVELCFSPFFHITLGTNLLTALFAGGEVWIQRRFDPGAALAAIDAGASRLMGAPTMFAALRNHESFATTRRKNVTAIRYGSAPSTGEFVQDLLRDFPNARIRAGFGATEFGSVIGFDHEDLLAGRFHGVGRPLPGVRIRVIDDDGLEVGPGMVGELVVSCPWQTQGYFGLPDATADAFKPDGVHIGDLVTRTEDGWLFIAGRKKEMIISGGENVFPREVEDAVLAHPDVADAIVYGMPDEFWGERVEVGIVPFAGAAVTGEAIRRHCRESLAGFKVPKNVRFMESIPLTANNKPDRRAVRAAAIEESRR